MRVFITGHRGQLGKALQEHLSSRDLKGGDLPDWDMTDGDAVHESIKSFRPDVVIHTAALTAVDYCARNPAEAVRVNGVGTYNIALACRDLNLPLVAVSTNEVFDGTAIRPYQEYDHRNPINPYGYSKFVAEQVVERFVSHYQIVRTAWLYAPGGTNFIHKIIDRAKAGGPLRVVTDEVGSPTYINDLAKGIMQLIDIKRPGIYHLTNAGACSRYDFAVEILRLAGIDMPVQPITSDAFERASTPPSYAPLDNVFGASQGVLMRPWQEALADYMSRIGL